MEVYAPLIQHTHLVSTLMLVGLIWVIQLVHYPLFGRVGTVEFAAYEQDHQRRITWIVAPLMLLEAGTAIAMPLIVDGTELRTIAYVGIGLLAVNWLSTALLQVPCHTRLSEQFDVATHRRLVNTNWIRTAAWSLRGGIAVLLFRAHLLG